MILVYVPCKDKKEAKKIGKELLENKLVACVNIFPVDSMYFWKGKLVDDEEIALLVKTIDKNYEKVEKHIKKLHSYDLPAIIKIDAGVSKEFGGWVKEQISN